jgi:hypothetical protein
MTGGGVFSYRNARGPTNFTSVNGYPQPTLVAFDTLMRSILVAGGADSGVFLSLDGGTNWMLVTDPFDPVAPGMLHIPRPLFAYFDHQPASLIEDFVNIFIGTKRRGVWRLVLRFESKSFPCMHDVESCFPALDKGLIELDCSGLNPGEQCVFVDPIPKNCL